MIDTAWMQNWIAVARSRKNCRRLTARSRRPVLLRLERLEDRLTPSGGNPTVTQTVGSYSALKAAVAADAAANTNYVIQITNDFTFNSGSQVTISKLGSHSKLTIEGQNSTNFTLTGNGNRLFTVTSGQDVTFADLTLTGGQVTGVGFANAQGGALLVQGGNVTLSNVAVMANTVSLADSPYPRAAQGGGVCVSAGGTLTIEGGSTIQSNQAIGIVPARGRGGYAEGGGVFVSGSSNLVISDSILSNNVAQGGQGFTGANGLPSYAGMGGGLYVAGSGWSVSLRGDILSGNRAIGGDGPDGQAGNNATRGSGQTGVAAGDAEGGAAYFAVSGANPSGTLTILDDPTHPSIFLDNSAQGGTGGNGGNGGASTGPANNSNGGDGGAAGNAYGGGVFVKNFSSPAALNITMGNTTFYGNEALGGAGGAGGAAGTGGSGSAGAGGRSGVGGNAIGGGVSLSVSGFTMANCTVANNSVTAGVGSGIGVAYGGGVNLVGATPSDSLDNNTITQNTLSGSTSVGAGLAVTGSPALVNNLIQGNSGNSLAHDLDVTGGIVLSNASNNFIGSISANAVSTTNNIVGNGQSQLGSVVGIDSNGKLTGGPVYYPLSPNAVSIYAGTTSVLNTIAAVEGTTAANATDEVGSPRSVNNLIDLGAVEYQSTSSFLTPVITNNPANQIGTAGANLGLTASAAGTPTPVVQWQVSTDGGNSFHNIVGATSSTLTLNSVTMAMNGYQFRAVFSNSSGSVASSAATLTVHAPAPPVLKVPPLLALFNRFLGEIETLNANGTETITNSFLGIPLFVSTFDSHGGLLSVTLFGIDLTFLFR